MCVCVCVCVCVYHMQSDCAYLGGSLQVSCGGKAVPTLVHWINIRVVFFSMAQKFDRCVREYDCMCGCRWVSVGGWVYVFERGKNNI